MCVRFAPYTGVSDEKIWTEHTIDMKFFDELKVDVIKIRMISVENENIITAGIQN